MEAEQKKALIDSSIWLERLRQQERDEEVKRLLDALFDDEIAISEFSVYSVGIIAMGNDRGAIYGQFLKDLFVDGECRAEPLGSMPTGSSLKRGR
jgi:predicted nucleic acid-binding protein